MAFRALLCSTNSETSTAMAAGCKDTGIRPEVCSDIFNAIEKGKTQAYSCIIADWADQPEASFLLKRARESGSNRTTVAIAIVDNEPTAAEMRDNRLDFLIYRPISPEEADAVLAKACEQMQPSNVQDLPQTLRHSEANLESSSAQSEDGSQQGHGESNSAVENSTEDNGIGEGSTEETAEAHSELGGGIA